MSAHRFAMFAISWDASTEAPRKSAPYRAKMIGQLSGEIFAYQMLPENIAMLEEILVLPESDPLMLRSAEKYLKEINKIRAIPQAEYVAARQNTAMTTRIWEEAKKANDFAMIAPHLANEIETNRRFLEYRGYSGHPYDLLLDDHEEGFSMATYDAFFGTLKQDLLPFVRQLHEGAVQIDDSLLYKFYDQASQKRFVEYLIQVMRFDMEAGVLKISAHPFTSGASCNDVRFTVRYMENYLPAAVFAGAHELGHAMHSQQGDPRFEGTNLQHCSAGMSESQSRFYENFIGRSLVFWQTHFGKLAEIFPEQMAGVTPEAFWRIANRTKPSMTRVEADELTYPMHIMIRYELEKQLFGQEIKVEDLPELWNSKYEEYLGLRPTNHALGIMQDIHWYQNLWGYFPTYALGTAYGAQFYYTLLKEVDLASAIAEDKMEIVNDWLRRHIHSQGGLYSPSELFRRVTGEEFNPQHLVRFLKEKYSEIYK
ncbi:MAG: carboxypeptidase M32 [Symbiobacteriaceae bacterium]|nr:carboxypeptidase M32 [Symbiobacteriaceae bacterium]